MMFIVPGFLALTTGQVISYTLTSAAFALLTFVVVAGLASYLRFEAMTQSEDGGREASSRDEFEAQILNRMGSGAKKPKPFGLLLVHPEELQDEASLERAADTLRKHVRREDALRIREDGDLEVLLSAPRRHLEGVMQRLARSAELSAAMPGFRIASVSFPENGSNYTLLVEGAQQGLVNADDGLVERWTLVPGEPHEDTEAPAPAGLLDPLTGVLKPDRMLSSLQKLVSKNRKNEMPLSLVCLDVDDLERYNRHYNREAGDAVLAQLGTLIDAGFRGTDLIGRYDEDQFLIALNCPADQALRATRRFAGEVRKNPFEFNGMMLKITVSAGLAGFPEHGHVPRELFDAASAALQTAKSRGVGSVALYEKGECSPVDADQPVDRM